MKQFEIPEMEVSTFDVVDVITTSPTEEIPNENETPPW